MSSSAPASATGLSSAMRFVPVLLVFTVLFGGYQLLLRTALKPATYSENPSQSSLINIQSSFYDDRPEVAVVGSSISARLLDDFFAEQGLPVMALGLDGQGPALGIDLLAETDRVPGTVVMEINRSLYSSSGNEEAIDDAVSSVAFDLAEEVPGLRAESRPTSVLYSELKLRQDPSGEPDSGGGLVPDVWVQETDPGFDVTTLTEEQQEGAARVERSLAEVESGDACLVFFIAPDRDNAGPAEQAFAEYLSFTYGAPVVDLRSLESQTPLVYTDNVHLDVASARLVSHVLADVVDGERSAQGCAD